MSDEVDQKLEDAKNEYLEKKKQPITINLINAVKPKGDDTNSETNEVERLKEELLEQRQLNESIITLQFEKKKESLGCSDESIDTVDKLMAWEKGKTGNSHSGKGAGGEVSLTPEQIQRELGHNEGFNSKKEMYEWAKKNDPIAYKKLLIHNLKLLRSIPYCEIPEPELEDPSKSIIGNFIEKKNRELREKRMGKSD